jgi:hypothetical protein
MPVNPRPWRAAWCSALLERFGFDVEREDHDAPVWEEGMDPEAVKPSAESEQAQAPVEEVAGKEAELEASVQGS